MLEIGDTYTQTFTVEDSTGTPVDPSPYACTITLPDLTTATPTITHVSTGVFQIVYAIPQIGQFSLVFTGTVGGNTFTQSDVFNVSVGAGAAFLLSLADARTAIGFPSTDTSKDESLRTVMAGATPIMEDIIGPCVSLSRIETYDGGNVQIALAFAPVLSVTEIIEAAGSNYVRTLTAQNVFSGSGSNDAYGYTIDLTTGIVTRLASGVPINFLSGTRNIQITYVTGRVLKGNQILAARRLIRHLWQSEQQGFRPQMGAPDMSMGSTPSGFAVPKAVIELCGPDTRAPGIG